MFLNSRQNLQKNNVHKYTQETKNKCSSKVLRLRDLCQVYTGGLCSILAMFETISE